MWWIPVTAGIGLLSLLMLDVFGTVFVPRGGAGVTTELLYRSVWAVWRRLSQVGPWSERPFLALAGLLLLPTTVVLWALELVLAFALIYLPWRSEFVFPQSDGGSGFIASLYVSAYSATTLGVGDVYPEHDLLRLLMVVEAAFGFALFTVAITYLLSVYNALRRATALALNISQFTGRQAGEDAVDVIARMAQCEGEDEVTSWLTRTSSALGETAQAAAQYPLVEYFHVPDDDRALPLALGDLLTLLTVCRAVLDPQSFPRLVQGTITLWAYRTAATFVQTRSTVLDGTSETRIDDEGRSAWFDAHRRLEAAGVAVRNSQQVSPRGDELAEEWELGVAALRGHFGYPQAPLLSR